MRNIIRRPGQVLPGSTRTATNRHDMPAVLHICTPMVIIFRIIFALPWKGHPFIGMGQLKSHSQLGCTVTCNEFFPIFFCAHATDHAPIT